MDIVTRVVLAYLNDPEKKQNFDKLLDDVNKKIITNSKDFYADLNELDISKKEFESIVHDIIDTGNSEEIVKLVFLLGEGKPMKDNSPSKGLKIFSEEWVARQLDDRELVRKVKPKFWPLFRDKEWLSTMQK